MPVLGTKARWAAPFAVAAVVAAGIGGVSMIADAAPPLPAKSAGELLVNLAGARVEPLSGTVVQNAELGLPELPTVSGGQGSSDLSSLISGSHTLRVWYGGPEKARVALLGTLGESDIIANGRDVWIWESQRDSAAHFTLPAEKADKHPMPADIPMTPQQAADQALALLGPTTNVTTDGTARVAGRAAYELVLSPKDPGSLIGSVRLALDGEKYLPLRVRIFPRTGTKPAFEVGFTQVSFAQPSEAQFRFTPPPNTTVREGSGIPITSHGATVVDSLTKVVGESWTSVVVTNGSLGDLNGSSRRERHGESDILGQVLSGLAPVSGPWGSGRLLQGSIFSAVLTNDGRIAAGAVQPDLLYKALGTR